MVKISNVTGPSGISLSIHTPTFVEDLTNIMAETFIDPKCNQSIDEWANAVFARLPQPIKKNFIEAGFREGFPVLAKNFIEALGGTDMLPKSDPSSFPSRIRPEIVYQPRFVQKTSPVPVPATGPSLSPDPHVINKMDILNTKLVDGITSSKPSVGTNSNPDAKIHQQPKPTQGSSQISPSGQKASVKSTVPVIQQHPVQSSVMKSIKTKLLQSQEYLTSVKELGKSCTKKGVNLVSSLQKKAVGLGKYAGPVATTLAAGYDIANSDNKVKAVYQNGFSIIGCSALGMAVGEASLVGGPVGGVGGFIAGFAACSIGSYYGYDAGGKFYEIMVNHEWDDEAARMSPVPLPQTPGEWVLH